MAVTWPFVPADARANLTQVSARQVPWLSSQDPAVTELLLTLNDGLCDDSKLEVEAQEASALGQEGERQIIATPPAMAATISPVPPLPMMAKAGPPPAPTIAKAGGHAQVASRCKRTCPPQSVPKQPTERSRAVARVGSARAHVLGNAVSQTTGESRAVAKARSAPKASSTEPDEPGAKAGSTVRAASPDSLSQVRHVLEEVVLTGRPHHEQRPPKLPMSSGVGIPDAQADRQPIASKPQFASRRKLATPESNRSHSEPPAERSASSAGSRADVLHCHFFFSSPLCVERPVVLRLPWKTMRSPQIDAEAASWGLDFEPSQPSVVRAVQTGGLVSNWNEEQEHIEGLVRPGDELLWLSIAGMKEMVRGRSIATCLRALCTQLEPLIAHSESNDSASHVELVFRALRALSPLRVDDEISLLRDSGCQVSSSAATAHNVRALIAASECQILHFSLHCSVAQENILFLEDAHGKAHVIRAADIKNMFLHGQRHQGIRLIFLNACHSFALGMYFIGAGVRHVVCVKSEEQVRDESCCFFARDFFRALRAGRSVQEAFDCGRAVLACSQEQHLRKDAGSFVLLPDGGDHTAVFAPPGGARFADKPSMPEGGSWGTVFCPVEDFLGREADLHRLLHLIHHRRFVEVQGEPGIGKSCVLSEIGRFLLPRRDAFEEVRCVKSGSGDVNVRQDYVAGLECLRRRLSSHALRLRVLLILDAPEKEIWNQLFPLLRFSNVHMVLTSTSRPLEQMAESDASAGATLFCGIGPAAQAAVEAGLKPTSFSLGPLEPLAQARLLLRRAPRPLSSAELENRVPEPGDEILQPPQRPVDFIRLAAAPLLTAFGGNPAKLVTAAARLGLSLPTTEARNIGPPAPRALSADASAGPSQHAHGGLSIATRRRVRLVRPDGRSRDEWLPRLTSIQKVLDEHSPTGLHGSAAIFIEGGYAPPDALLGDFPDDSQLGVLILEFRSSSTEAREEW